MKYNLCHSVNLINTNRITFLPMQEEFQAGIAFSKVQKATDTSIWHSQSEISRNMCVCARSSRARSETPCHGMLKACVLTRDWRHSWTTQSTNIYYKGNLWDDKWRKSGESSGRNITDTCLTHQLSPFINSITKDTSMSTSSEMSGFHKHPNSKKTHQSVFEMSFAGP